MTLVPALLLQDDSGLVAGGLMAMIGSMMLVFLGIAVLFIIGGWKVFAKAGQPGWAVIIPIFNIYILLKIIGRPAWWILLCLIPLVNIAIAVIISIDLAKSFGQGAAFGLVLLFLLGGIGYLVLGFGNYRYLGPAGASAAVAMA
jgi:hypothetical protein